MCSSNAWLATSTLIKAAWENTPNRKRPPKWSKLIRDSATPPVRSCTKTSSYTSKTPVQRTYLGLLKIFSCTLLFWLHLYLDEHARSLGTGVIHSCEQSEYLELNSGPVEVQSVLLSYKPSLQALTYSILYRVMDCQISVCDPLWAIVISSWGLVLLVLQKPLALQLSLPITQDFYGEFPFHCCPNSFTS